MSNITQRIKNFEKEREEIREKMLPLKNQLKPLSKRLAQVSRNIATAKFIEKQEKVW